MRELDEFSGRLGGFGNVIQIITEGDGVYYSIKTSEGIIEQRTYADAINAYYKTQKTFSKMKEMAFEPAVFDNSPSRKIKVNDLGPVPKESPTGYMLPISAAMSASLAPKSVAVVPVVLVPGKTNPPGLVAPMAVVPVVLKPAVAQAPAVKAVVTVNWLDTLIASIKNALGIR